MLHLGMSVHVSLTRHAPLNAVMPVARLKFIHVHAKD